MADYRILFPDKCEKCHVTKINHRLRRDILYDLKNQGFPVDENDIRKFEELSKFGRCELHREFTVYPTETWKRRACFGDGELKFEWWSNNHTYTVVVSKSSVLVFKDGSVIFHGGSEELIKETITDILLLVGKEKLERIKVSLNVDGRVSYETNSQTN